MKILITGAKGFVGKNLVESLKNIRDGKDKTRGIDNALTLFEYDVDTDKGLLNKYAAECDFVYHLAGVNRTETEDEFMAGNFGFTSELLALLKKHNNKAPVLVTSSIQAALDNPYGVSKKAGEDLFFSYGTENGVKTLVYRLPNVFGKWCRPNYNSAVATFCHNIANALPITVNDRSHMMTLVYIDDVVDELIRALKGQETREDAYCRVPVEHKITLGEIVDLIYSFKEQSRTLVMPEIPANSFAKKLYSTYLSYLPKEKAAFSLKMNEDERGSFTELLKTGNCGQFSVNISKPGITKGQHWHHSKWEFFIVVSGRGLIQQRKVGTDEVLEFEVSGEKIEAVHMLPGYTHNIINLSETENLVTVMWANEQFDKERPDTFFLPVWQDVKEPSENPSVLVLGGAGMAGFVVSTYLKEQGYDVTIFDINEVAGFSCVIGSATDIIGLKKILLTKTYTAVINCIGLLNKACDENQSLAVFLNGYLPHFIADVLKDTKTKFLHISSDCVFSGNNPPYDELAIPDASDNYGKTKAVGEVNNEKDITFRTSIVGPDRSLDKMGLVNWFMQQRECMGFEKVMWSGVSTITLARAMKAAIEQNISGIYNLVNNDFISKYELLRLFNKYLRDNRVNIEAVTGKTQRKIIVNTRKDFNFVVPTYEEMVKEIAEWIDNHPEVYMNYKK